MSDLIKRIDEYVECSKSLTRHDDEDPCDEGLYRDIKSQLKENNRQIEVMRKALKFYANEDKWHDDDWGIRAVLYGGELKSWERAEKALDSLKE